MKFYMKIKKIYTLSLLLLVSTGTVSHVFATSSNQVQISADRINYMQETGEMILEENVEIILNDVRMYADKVIAYSSKETENQFEKIVATGNVRIVTQDRKVFGQRAVFYNDTQKIRITGEPMVQEKAGNVLEANAIIFDIRLNKVSFEGRARARVKISDKEKSQYSRF